MEIKPFELVQNPRLVFGLGTFEKLPDLIASMGDVVLIVTGGSSFEASGGLEKLQALLKAKKIQSYHYSFTGEPSPEIVDEAASEYRRKHVHAVVSIGGGSVIDAGKAISAMIPFNESVEEYLEGVGKKKHDGTKAPFIAVPTTAGTGSECAANAVISKIGPAGYKRSLRHPGLIPDVALVDPELTMTCPAEVTAASGLDAVSQLLESYFSTAANPMTDALCEKGLAAAGKGFPAVCADLHNRDAREAMSLAAMISGITLTNAGLGAIHGMAGVIGGKFEVPHGVVCGTLLAETYALTLSKLEAAGFPGNIREKMCRAAELLSSGKEHTPEGLVKLLADWADSQGIPKFGEFGIKLPAMEAIIPEFGSKNHPVAFTREDFLAVLKARV